MSPEQRKENAADELRDAAEVLREAEVLAREGLHRGAVQRLYYACFHLARALLFTVGLDPKSHQGVLRLLHSRFVRTGKLRRRLITTYEQLKESRENADYTSGWVLGAAEWAELRPAADELMQEIRALLREAEVPGA